MRNIPVVRWSIPVAVAAGLAAASLPCTAEARGGGGGGFGGGFHGGGFHGGGFGGGFHGGGFGGGFHGGGFHGSTFGSAFHGGGFHGSAVHGSGFARGGIAVGPRGGAAGPSGHVFRGSPGFIRGRIQHPGRIVLVPRGYRAQRFGAAGIPLIGGVVVPPLLGGAAPPPIGPGAGMPEIWRWDGAAWRLDRAPLPVTAWRLGGDGRWHPDAAN
jgi:hypothetical protein